MECFCAPHPCIVIGCFLVNLSAIGRDAHELTRQPTPASDRRHAPLPCCFAMYDNDWLSWFYFAFTDWPDSHARLPHGHAHCFPKQQLTACFKMRRLLVLKQGKTNSGHTQTYECICCKNVDRLGLNLILE